MKLVNEANQSSITAICHLLSSSAMGITVSMYVFAISAGKVNTEDYSEKYERERKLTYNREIFCI